jgi:hypothetical protein
VAVVAGGRNDVFELLGLDGDVGPQALAARDIYECALAAYLDRRFEEAAAAFDTAARLRPDDGAAGALAARSRQYVSMPPPGNWSGVHAHTRK